ncbi:MAG TPA: hypothetical protein VNZ52_09705, partial [Candidatus Thermoplasmatota archaeon]|nr:hypothetical protein [Candidatus Thermoplasmatota archaeon]
TAPSFTGIMAKNWWQQVTVSGSVAAVDVRINDGAWMGMAKQSWGGWGISKPLNAGDKVQFQARMSDGKTYASAAYKANGDGSVSAWTTGSTTPPASTAPSFTGIMAKNWWQQVTVSGSPVRVDVRINDGAWIQMTKQSWGGYGVSKPLNAGDKVQFQAGMPDGKWHWSPAYKANGDGSVTYLYG